MAKYAYRRNSYRGTNMVAEGWINPGRYGTPQEAYNDLNDYNRVYYDVVRIEIVETVTPMKQITGWVDADSPAS